LWVRLLAACGMTPSLWGSPSRAAAAEADWTERLFAAKNVREAAAAIGAGAPIDTRDVAWGNTPDIAENGQVVPISIASRVPGTEAIGVLIEKNPNPMAAWFDVLPGTDATFRTNFKLGESSSVVALIKAGGKLYTSSHEIKVTIGGCGG